MNALSHMYRLCDRPVTIYRRYPDGTIGRRCVKAYYEDKSQYIVDNLGTPHLTRSYLIITPTDDPDLIQPQDRIMPGEGEPIRADEWATFLPATNPGMMIVQYSAPYYLNGEVRHVEAGGAL